MSHTPVRTERKRALAEVRRQLDQLVESKALVMIVGHSRGWSCGIICTIRKTKLSKLGDAYDALLKVRGRGAFVSFLASKVREVRWSTDCSLTEIKL